MRWRKLIAQTLGVDTGSKTLKLADGSASVVNHGHIVPGVHLRPHHMLLAHYPHGKEFNLVELAGTDPFGDFLSAVVRVSLTAHGQVDSVSMVLLVFDVTNEASFKSCEQWMKKFVEEGGRCKCKSARPGSDL
jgi:hypothetical protein